MKVTNGNLNVSLPSSLTRRGDELARRRQELPWVRVDKEYQFETDAFITWWAIFRKRDEAKRHFVSDM
jgi:predicted dithiol-disulfide oxidoreductase (DUF899 family)